MPMNVNFSCHYLFGHIINFVFGVFVCLFLHILADNQRSVARARRSKPQLWRKLNGGPGFDFLDVDLTR